MQIFWTLAAFAMYLGRQVALTAFFNYADVIYSAFAGWFDVTYGNAICVNSTTSAVYYV